MGFPLRVHDLTSHELLARLMVEGTNSLLLSNNLTVVGYPKVKVLPLYCGDYLGVVTLVVCGFYSSVWLLVAFIPLKRVFYLQVL